MRDEFSNSTKETLAKRVGYRCSNPGCRQATCGPQDEPTKTLNVGVAAHIAAASTGGPRFDALLTSQERAASGNGIWLCQRCAKLVDNDESRYTVEVLRSWKRGAEAAARGAIERPSEERFEDERFRRLEQLMPQLLAEMREDLSESPLRREFVLLKRRWSYWASGSELVYYFDDHDELESKMRVLENMGLIYDITATNVTRYTMTEELAEYLGAYGAA